MALALLVISPDDHGARRDIGDWLKLSGGQLPVEEVRIRFRRAFNYEPHICSERLLARAPGLEGFRIENGMVKLS